MKIVSIDVGAENLAIFVGSTEKQQNNKDPVVEVIYWDVVSIFRRNEAGQIVGKPTCGSVVKSTRKICGKKASSFLKRPDSEEIKYFCKVHRPAPEEIATTEIDPKKKKAVKSYTPQEICVNLIKTMDCLTEGAGAKFSIPEMDFVIIEQQPKKNQRMKSISEMLMTYFLIKQAKQVRFVSAKYKLSVYKGPEIFCRLKDPYARRKFIGIQHCRYFLQKCSPDWLNYFNQFKKMDDAADAYLMFLWFVSGFKKLLNLEFNE